ncbi:MAG: hypothetical protein AAGF47_05595 [Planctomycetota bacterium]
MTTATNSAEINSWTPDAELAFGSLGVGQNFTADGTLLDGGSDAVIDFGVGGAVMPLFLVDVSVLDTTSGNETYEVIVDFASDLAFSSDVMSYKLTVTRVGRYFLPTANRAPDSNGLQQTLQYARARVDVGGTTPSITLAVYGVKSPNFG